MPDVPEPDRIQAAYGAGRRQGLAIAALALSIVAFINLLGFEKSLLAAVLAVLSLKGGMPAMGSLRRGWAALVIAVVHILTISALLIAFHDQLAQLIHLLQKLS